MKDQEILIGTANYAKKLGIDIAELTIEGNDLPTQCNMMRYLREVKGLHIRPSRSSYSTDMYYVVGTIQGIGTRDVVNCRKQCKTMEDAYEEGIRKVLKEIERKRNDSTGT